MPKDSGEKQNRLAELRRAWYERPKADAASKTSEPAKRASEPVDANDDQELEGVAEREPRKGKRGAATSKKKTAEPTPLELAASEPSGD